MCWEEGSEKLWGERDKQTKTQHKADEELIEVKETEKWSEWNENKNEVKEAKS